MILRSVLLCLPLLSLAACGESTAPASSEQPAAGQSTLPSFPVVAAVAETEPVNTEGDAADDMAIWVDEANPERSLIIGTAKKSGINVYDLQGRLLQFLPSGRVNNVDMRRLEINGAPVWILAASERNDKAIVLYRLNPESRSLETVGAPIPTGFVDPYGVCLYHSAKNGDLFVFVTEKESGFAQWRITLSGDGAAAEKVRDLPVATQSEGCVADDTTGNLYLAEEGVGIWRFAAEPDQPATATPVALLTDRPEMAADVEGLTIYRRPDGSGYLIASSQGNNSYAVFRLSSGYDYLGSFAIGGGAIDAVSETDGIDVTSANLGGVFAKGMFVAQDGVNTDPDGNQNFKMVPWSAIADALKLD